MSLSLSFLKVIPLIYFLCLIIVKVLVCELPYYYIIRAIIKRDSPPKNENSVIYSPSCRFKPVWLSFFCETQKKIFWRMLITLTHFRFPFTSIVWTKKQKKSVGTETGIEAILKLFFFFFFFCWVKYPFRFEWENKVSQNNIDSLYCTHSDPPIQTGKN